jgi:hypothetical protein
MECAHPFANKKPRTAPGLCCFHGKLFYPHHFCLITRSSICLQ